MGNNIMLRRSMLCLGLLVMAIYHTCDACSPPINWKPQEVSKRAAIADIVIVGKVVRSHHHRATRERKARRRERTGREVGLYDARIEVLCALKGGPLPQFIEVSGFGQVPGHCVDSPALQNATYVVFLRQRKGRYSVAEVNNQRGTIPFKQHLVRKIAKKIGTHARNRCANIFVKNRRTTKPAVDSDVVFYLDHVETKEKVTPTTEMMLAAQSLRDVSNGASTMKLVWGVPMSMVVYFLGHLLT